MENKETIAEDQDISKEEAINLEPELDTSDPDKTPLRYQKMVEENNRLVGEMANEIMNAYVMKSNIPYAFIEVLPQVLNAKIKIIKGRSKAFEEINKLSNKAHLTPVAEMELYEYNQVPANESEDLGGE